MTKALLGSLCVLAACAVGPPGTFSVLPFHEALAAAKQGEPIAGAKGAVVLIGVTARTQQDYHATPYANLYTRWLPGGTIWRTD